MGEWISVKDRLPDKQDLYLVYSSGTYTVQWFNGYEWVIYSDEWAFEAHEITHWMPLPEPPKEG